MMQTGINPKFEIRKTVADCADRRPVVATAFDGVEIGDIEHIEWIKRHEVARCLDRRDGGRQPGDKRAIIGAPTSDGAHNGAVSNINDGNDPHEAL